MREGRAAAVAGAALAPGGRAGGAGPRGVGAKARGGRRTGRQVRGAEPEREQEGARTQGLSRRTLQHISSIGLQVKSCPNY